MPHVSQKIINSNKGQSLVEFILLFVVLTTLSLGVVKGINGNLANYWQAMSQAILQDPAQQLTLR